MTSGPHLWEVDHPYYAERGCFYAAPHKGAHQQYGSWAEFRETVLYDGDRDLNLLYRWDWLRDEDEVGGRARLQLYFMMQRKAAPCSAYVDVTDADEPQVRAWLDSCARTLAAIWEPLEVAT